MAAEIRPYMPEYQHRWPFIGGVRGDWESSLQWIKDFNNERPDHMKEHILKWLDTEKIFPVNFKLLQNYPNPVVGSTTIRYQLPQAGEVLIRIINAHGQQIFSYRNRHDTGGHFSMEFDARGHGSGIYFYSLEVEGRFLVKKMTVL
jgi:hypothetical protein